MAKRSRLTLNSFSDNRGVSILLVMLVMSLLLYLSIYFLASSLSELKIAKSQIGGVKAYYLAETGINEMIWRVINDPLYEHNFKYSEDWATTTIRVDPFGPGSGSYTVTASNTSASHCDIVSTGAYDIGASSTAQRIVRIEIFRAIGTSTVGDSAGYADGNITITNSYIKFLNGSAHSNNTFDVNNQNVQMIVDSNLEAAGNYLEHNLASTTINGWIYADNWASYAKGTGTASEIDMPAIDFNSSDPDSLKNQAIDSGTYFSEADFDDLLRASVGGNLTLTADVTYIEGDVALAGDITLRYPPTGGVLVVDGDLTVGSKNYKQCGGTKHYGNPDIVFMHVAGKPSGILSSSKIQFLANTGDIDIEGVVYADAEMDIKNITSDFYVAGGLISQKLDIDSCYNWPTIVHDNSTLVDTIGAASSSPTIIVEHWEEEY